MKIHPREQTTTIFELDLEKACHEVIHKNNEVTSAELIRAINNVSHRLIHNAIKYEIRMERHGNYTTKENLAPEEKS